MALPSENEKVASAECRLDFTTTDCGNLDQDQASTGWEAHGGWHKVGCIRVVYSSAAITKWEFTRETAWDSTCGVHLLHNNEVVGSVPTGVGDSTSHKMRVDVNVEAGDHVELCEGLDSATGAADNTVCGFHIYSIETCAGQAAGNQCSSSIKLFHISLSGYAMDPF